jgi:prepilin-type processing-associated H-X9-DG protein
MTAVEEPLADRITSDVAAPSLGLPKVATKLYVAGGQQRTLRGLTADMDSWYEYQKGIILELDTATGVVETKVGYISPPDVCPAESPAILFKSGTLVDDRLYLCTQTEVMVYSVPSFERVAYISLPFFNDVHHVRPLPNGNLLVANTGLDMVVELTLGGDVVTIWNVLGEDPWQRFSREIDYRRVPTTKPHLAHPNHVFLIGDEPWATRFQQKDAISLADPSRRIDIGLERVHDGVVHNGRVYFTTVDGHVAIADTTTLELVNVVDLTKAHPDDMLLGWARGLMLEDDRMWVGFSRIRPTKIRENVGWVLRGLKRDFGTHVGCYDLATGRSLAQVGVERSGLSAIFGIYPVPEPAKT